MYQFEFITVGKLKHGPHKELVDEYEKRLGQYANIEHTVVAEERFDSQNQRERVLKKEADRIRKKISRDAFSILLSEDGKLFRSKHFALKLSKWSENERRNIQFITGGPLGVDRSLQNDVDFTLSLSPLTMPHDLAQVVLLEQVYRAMTILKGKTYHY
jgi:23S rRNA (pseudouridine1915-N3)-methyltransferase